MVILVNVLNLATSAPVPSITGSASVNISSQLLTTTIPVYSLALGSTVSVSPFVVSVSIPLYAAGEAVYVLVEDVLYVMTNLAEDRFVREELAEDRYVVTSIEEDLIVH